MDYIWKAIGIVFLVTVVIFIYNALKIQHGSDHFPNQKDDSEKKENDKWTIIDKSKTSKAVLLLALNKRGGNYGVNQVRGMRNWPIGRWSREI